jgi:hypothetical protein
LFFHAKITTFSDILRRAETRECETHQDNNELLNSFKYANFTIDEEKDLALLAGSENNNQNSNDSTSLSNDKKDTAQTSNKDWAEIIPQEDIERIKEEEQKKANENLYLGPRQRGLKVCFHLIIFKTKLVPEFDIKFSVRQGE